MLLQVNKLSSSYGRIRALRHIELEVKEGELVALVGANGAGKTTLMRAISGVQPIDGGSISFAGKNISQLAASKRVSMGISQVPEGRQIFAPLSVEDNLQLGAFTRPRTDMAGDMEKIYHQFPILKERRTQQAGTLSGGEQQMLALGRALMARPRLLLLDEPSMGLSPKLVDQSFEIIRRLSDQGVTIFLVEQNAYMALSIATRGYVMEGGKTVLSGLASDLLDDQRVKKAYLGV